MARISTRVQQLWGGYIQEEPVKKTEPVFDCPEVVDTPDEPVELVDQEKVNEEIEKIEDTPVIEPEQHNDDIPLAAPSPVDEPVETTVEAPVEEKQAEKKTTKRAKK